MSSTVLKKFSNDSIIIAMLLGYTLLIREELGVVSSNYQEWGYLSIVLVLLIPVLGFVLSKSYQSIPVLFAFPLGILIALRIIIFDYLNLQRVPYTAIGVLFTFGLVSCYCYFGYWKKHFKKHYDKNDSVFPILFLIAGYTSFFLASIILNFFGR